ncbi:MAG: hypothetical protein QW303_04365 [Nitrososphaerota archaeon]
MKKIVFDFDKTLSIKNSFNDYLYYVGRSNKNYRLRKFVYFFIVLLRKIKIISNHLQKLVGLNLFLPLDSSQVENYSKDFAREIELNKKVYSIYQKKKKYEIIICTSSPSIYIKEIFPEAKVIGLEFIKKKFYKITQHPYRKNKLIYLQQNGIQVIDELYTDSYDDEFLARISKKIFLVKKNSIIQIEDYESFKKNFNWVIKFWKKF